MNIERRKKARKREGDQGTEGRGDGKESEECQNNGGGPCEGSLLPGFLMAGGLLAAPFALGYGVGSAAGSDKVAACERRVRSTAPRAAR